MREKESRLIDKVLAIIARANATQFTTDSYGIGNVFHDMKEKFPGEFDGARFTLDEGNFHSDELESAFQSLSMFSVISIMGPDYRYYHVPITTMERAEKEIIPSLSPSFIEALPEMARLFKALVK